MDPAHYFTTPNLAWDAMLKKTGVKLELLTDYDMHLMIEQGLRGGIAMITHRHAEGSAEAWGLENKAIKNDYSLISDAFWVPLGVCVLGSIWSVGRGSWVGSVGGLAVWEIYGAALGVAFGG